MSAGYAPSPLDLPRLRPPQTLVYPCSVGLLLEVDERGPGLFMKQLSLA